MRAVFSIAFFLLSLAAAAQDVQLFVGTYTGTGSKGIYTYTFNTVTGATKLISHTDSASIENPSFLAVAPSKKYLYAVSETGGKAGGSLNAYAVDKSGVLRLLNKVPTGGDHPCYVSTSKGGNWALAGNYSGGNAAAFRINADGSLQPHSQVVQHEGKGVNTERQEKAHVHAAVFDPANNFVFVPDLGLDKVFIYGFNAAATKPLIPATPAFAASLPGSGPRHFTFHPNGKYAYLMEELSGTVAVYQYDSGKLTPVQNISSHLPDYTGSRGSADIHLSDDGKFLYASNRGDANSIAVFAVGKDGKLSWVEQVSSGGNSPRNFTLSPGGRFVLVANQETNNVVIMKRNAATGKLTSAGNELAIPKPVCVVFR
jgi:6-phosphogluconolactonase